VTASDFAVEIRNLPKVPEDSKILEFKSEMWKWIESLVSDQSIVGDLSVSFNAASMPTSMQCSTKLMDLNFGLSNHKRMEYLMEL